jgi:carotenoid cleavage dioxygenase
MTQPFPDNVYLSGPMAPSGIECDAPDLVVEGELPADLRGVYFRNGPDPLYPPREGDEYHWFHGDGMIQRFEFADGRVSWKNRWVRTEKYALERAAGQSLFGVLGNPFTADPSVAEEHYNTANTHIVWHGHRLLALMEGTIAVELEPDSLTTVGNFDYDGQIDGPITAHPKFDHASGENFCVSMSPTRQVG